MISSKKKFIKKVLKGSAIVIIAFVVISMISTKLIYDSVFKRYDAEENQNLNPEVTEILKTRKAYSYPCGDHSLSGYLYKSTEPTDDLIILIPGFRSESIQYSGVIHAFVESGFNVFSFDCTGHGDSEGQSSIGFPQIINDLNATLEFIESNRDFAYDDIFLLGHSRGGYAACCVLNEHNEISAAVSVNAVDSAMDGIMAYSVDTVGNVAYGNYPFLWLYQSMLFGTDVASRSAVEEINESDIPVLIIQAENDKQLAKDDFSLYSHRTHVNSENAQFVLYSRPNQDGHTTILYDEYGQANYDIVKSVSAFFKENTNQEDTTE